MGIKDIKYIFRIIFTRNSQKNSIVGKIGQIFLEVTKSIAWKIFADFYTAKTILPDNPTP